MRRVAAVDIGTNSTRLLVADVEDEVVHELDRRLEITRLGEGVDERRILLPQAIARVRNVLADYRLGVEEAGAERALAFATSAVRDAENGEAFLGEVEWGYGFKTQLATGDEEALLTRRGVQPPPGTLVLDIGGGSTELVLDDFHVSLPMGAVRFTERWGEHRAAIEEATTELLTEHANVHPRAAIGVAGTVTTLAALDLGLEEYDRDRVDGYLLTRRAAQSQLHRLAALPLEERRQVPALEPERAPVIVAGAAILVATLAYFGLNTITASEHDILDGIALAAADLPAPDGGDAPPGAFTCC